MGIIKRAAKGNVFANKAVLRRSNLSFNEEISIMMFVPNCCGIRLVADKARADKRQCRGSVNTDWGESPAACYLESEGNQAYSRGSGLTLLS